MQQQVRNSLRRSGSLPGLRDITGIAAVRGIERRGRSSGRFRGGCGSLAVAHRTRRPESWRSSPHPHHDAANPASTRPTTRSPASACARPTNRAPRAPASPRHRGRRSPEERQPRLAQDARRRLRQGGFGLDVATVGRILAKAAKRGRVRTRRRRDFRRGHVVGVSFKEFRAVRPFARRMFSRVFSNALRSSAPATPVASWIPCTPSRACPPSRWTCVRERLGVRLVRGRLQARPPCRRRDAHSGTTAWSAQPASRARSSGASAALDDCIHCRNDERPRANIGMTTPSEHFATLQATPKPLWKYSANAWTTMPKL